MYYDGGNMEPGKRLRKERQILLKEIEESNPDFVPGNKQVFSSLAIVVVLQFINLVFGVAFRLHYGIPFKLNEMAVFVWPLLLSFIFARLIYSFGSKLLIYLMLLGGIASLVFAYINDVFYNLNTPYILFNIIGIFTIAASLAQTVSMLFLLLGRKCKTYFALIVDFNKKLSEKAK